MAENGDDVGTERHEDSLRRVLAHLLARTGHDFSKFKRAKVLRRIARRMRVVRAEDLTEYYEIMRDSPEEAQALFDDLRISMTTFFRHRETFQIGATVSETVALSEAAMHRHALEQAAPPSMLVDESHRVIHLSENAGRFVMPSRGPLSGDAADLVRPELRFELRSALYRAFEQTLPTLSMPALVSFDRTRHRVHLMVKPVQESGADQRTAIVMFIEGEEVDETGASADLPTGDETVRRLTQELELTQARLRTVREESDAANEELRAANEELQSINEEYRSTSEELETSKEELQSINEELRTVNSELKLKLEAISRAHSDFQNLIAATDSATLFLDSGLRIKRFTDRATELFSITRADEGRMITDFAHRLQYDDLAKDACAVLADLAPIRREIRSRSGRRYDMRIRAYRTVDDKIDGVVVTFVDVFERPAAEAAPARE